MPNFEDDSGNCHAPDPNGVACYKSRIGCPIHPRQKRKCHECPELSALRLDNERLRDQIYESIPKWQANEMQREINKLRDALRWYADPLNHSPVKCHFPGDPDPSVVFLMELPPIINDGGKRARQALDLEGGS